MNKHAFQLKISSGLNDLCRCACMHLDRKKGTERPLAERKHFSLAHDLQTITSLTVDQVGLLEESLVQYADEVLADDEEARNLARGFAGVLGDFRATPPSSVLEEDPASEQARAGLAALHRRSVAEANQKRDEIFRHIFGLDADLTVWGTKRE